MNDLLSNPSLKRAVVAGLTAALIALNKKLGLDMGTESLAMLTGLAIAFIGQSAAKEVKMAGIDAAAKVTDTKAAVDIINGPAPANTTVNVGPQQ